MPVTVITGDGFEGYGAGAPYDRVIATVGVREIPFAWIEQTSPGGVIVIPWETHFSNQDAVARRTVSDDGTSASRHFAHPVEFTKLRSQRLPFAGLAIGLRVPQCTHSVAPKREGARPVWFYGLDDTSWACAFFRDGRPETTVYQSGPRRLWDEVEAAHVWWEGVGRPGHERFGLTVTEHQPPPELSHQADGLGTTDVTWTVTSDR
ncbi:hypothetical protein [Streptomyces sp. NPDC088196]|uniref:hypothetical protein n=1 Tax=Streptomyces sp. NPDC088196 TaxID=3154868 RepID=UPI00344C91F6